MILDNCITFINTCIATHYWIHFAIKDKRQHNINKICGVTHWNGGLGAHGKNPVTLVAVAGCGQGTATLYSLLSTHRTGE